VNRLAFLIDTDWAIDHLRGVEAVTARLGELEPEGLAISVISVAELWEGVHYSRDPTASERGLSEFLMGPVVLNLDEETCKHFGRLRGALRRQGNMIGDLDLLIAATAVRHGLTVLTNNRKHFEHVPRLRIESRSQ
jgi:tRNA(fMet)-specific endonuclease VapC